MSSVSNHCSNETVHELDHLEAYDWLDKDELDTDVSDDVQGEVSESSDEVGSILPPSSGPIRSSPIVGTKAERVRKRIQKGYNKRRVTLEKRMPIRQAKRDTIKAAKQCEQKAQRQGILEETLQNLRAQDLQLWDLMEYVFNPANGQGTIRYNEFFARPKNASRVLDWWMAAKNREAEAVTKSRELQTRGRTIDADILKQFDFETIHDQLASPSDGLAPFTMRILHAFTTAKRVQKHKEKRKQRTKMIITSTAMLCLGEYSHSNNLAKRMLGLYLYASGAPRQCITVLSKLGLSESYTNLTSRNIRRTRKVKQAEDPNPFIEPPDTEALPTECVIRTGTLHQLSDSMRAQTRQLAATGLYSVVYDNININFKNAEQIIGRHDSQENGTCATLVPLFDAKIEDLDLQKFQSAYLQAPHLKLEHILHTPEEQKVFNKYLICTLLRIIVTYGGPGFKKFERDLEEYQLSSTEKIPLHTSELHPLPSWNIDKSSIVGNAEVDRAIIKELGLESNPEAANRVRFLGGDQLSLARLRALEFIRAGQEGGYEGFFWGAWIPGLFHAKIADTHGTLLNHYGNPESAAHNPGSLCFQNSRLDRLPITLTSLPTYRTSCDLIFVSLYARVLHCLLLVSKAHSLEEYILKTNKWDTLVTHATIIYQKYANSALDDLHSQRIESLKGQEKGALPTAGDAIFENASLFLRDALISREFHNGIKAGDSGRVLLVLKVWALSFRGNGRTKYAYEMLHLIHNLTNVWPKAIRDIVMKNWLLNPSGLPNHFVEMDLVQEHLNFKVKVSYKAHGSNASWEWLETISPCVVALADLQKMFNDTLGDDQGIRHAPPNLKADINSLMHSFDEHNIYRIQKGRMLKEEDIVKDVIAIGLLNLTSTEKNPIHDYNTALVRLQKRRKMIPVSLDMLQAHSETPMVHPPLHTQPTSSGPIPTIPATEDNEAGEGYTTEMTEAKQILQDLMNGVVDETLPRLTEEDVSFDIDEVATENEVVDEDESDTSDSDIGWDSEEESEKQV